MNNAKIDRMEELLKSSKVSMEKAKGDLKAEYEKKKKYLKENKDFSTLDKTSPVGKKYNREIEDYDNRIKFHKNTMRYNIEDIINYANKINKEIEPYISCTDSMAKVNITLFEQEKTKINDEIKNIEKQISLYPEYNKLYTEDGKKEFANLENKVIEKKKQLQELDDKIWMYQNRDDLMKKYKANLKTITDAKKIAKENLIDLNDKSYAEEKPSTPSTAPSTPSTAPSTPSTAPSTPSTAPSTPSTAPSTPSTAPSTPSTAPSTPSTAPSTPSTAPSTPSTAPSTPSTAPSTPSTAPSTPSTAPSTPSTAPSTPSTKIKIKVGRKVDFEFKGKTAEFSERIDSEELRDVVNKLSDKEKMKMIKDILEKPSKPMEESYKRKIQDNIHKIDDAVLYTLSRISGDAIIDDDEKKLKVIEVATGIYLEEAINKKKLSGMDIEYDRKDLSKGHISSLPIIRRFTGQMTRKQKDYINEMSEISSDFSTSTGIYEKNPFKRFLAERKQKKFPVQEVQHSNSTLNKLKDYKLAPDPDKNKSIEQIQKENARAAQRQAAIRENSGPER